MLSTVFWQCSLAITNDNKYADLSGDDSQASMTVESQDATPLNLGETAQSSQPRQESVVSEDYDSLGITAREDTPLLSPSSESRWERYTSCRWTLGCLLGAMTMLVHCQRSCLSMALVCMDPACGGRDPFALPNTSYERNTSHTAEYISSEKKGMVLAGYYFGYLATPFLAGILMERLNLGPKRLLSVSMATAAALTLLTPSAVRWSVEMTVALRVVLGLAAGTALPCLTAVLGWWSPQQEMAKLMGLAASGTSTGYLLANMASGFICSVPVDEGWPFIFYTFGLVGAVWALTWEFTAYDTPESHPRISSKERSLILQQRCAIADTANTQTESAPWRSVLTSGPFLSLCVTQMAFDWTQCVFSVYIPFFLNQQLHYRVSKSGLVSSLPYLSRALFSVGFSTCADHLYAMDCVSVSVNRKLFQTLGLVVPGGLLVAAGYLGAANPGMSVVMLVMSVGFHAAADVSFRINALDLAPRYAGTLSGASQTLGNIVLLICPMVTSAVVADDLPSSWTSAFNITGIVALLGAVVFIAFGSGKQQPWAV